MMFYPNFSTETGSSVSTPPAANDPVTEPGSSSEENEACVTSQSVVVGECQLEEEPSKDSILSLLGMRYLAPVGSNQDSFYEEQAASFVGQPLSFLADGPGQLSFSSFSALPPSFSPAPSRYSSSSFLTAASTVSPLLSSPRGVLYTPPSPSSSYPHQSQHQQLHQPDQYQHQHRTQSRGPPQISSSYSHSSPSLSCSTASSPYHQQQQRYYYQQQQLNNHQFYSDQTYSNSSAAYASSSPCHHHSQQKHHHQAPYGYRGRSPLHYQSLSLRDTASPEFPMCGRKRPAETAPMHHDDIGHCDDNCQQEDQNLTITESHYPQQPLHQGQSQHQQQNGCQSRQQQLVMGNKAKKRRVRKTWTERFQQLKEFKARFGHCKVPKGWSEDPKLARWVRFFTLLESHCSPSIPFSLFLGVQYATKQEGGQDERGEGKEA